MKFKATSGSGVVELPKAGSYKAVVTGIYDIGTHDGGMYGPKRQLVVEWQLFKGNKAAINSQGEEQTACKFYGMSFNEKSTLRQDVERMLGKKFSDGQEFDSSALLGKACRLQLVDYTKQNGNPGIKISSLMQLDEDEDTPAPSFEPFEFFLNGANCPIPEAVPEWIANQIRTSHEWAGTQIPSKAAKAPFDELQEVVDGITANIKRN
jgi:hypothetical protein